jgi:hypothetical protein
MEDLASAKFSDAYGTHFSGKRFIFRADEFSRSYSTVRSDSENARKSNSMIRASSAEVSV